MVNLKNAFIIDACCDTFNAPQWPLRHDIRVVPAMIPRKASQK